MFPEIVQLGRFHHAWGHILVLDALVGYDGGGKMPAQIHGGQPLYVQLGNGVIALPEGLQICWGHSLEGSFQLLRPFQKDGQSIRGKAIRVHHHFLSR